MRSLDYTDGSGRAQLYKKRHKARLPAPKNHGQTLRICMAGVRGDEEGVSSLMSNDEQRTLVWVYLSTPKVDEIEASPRPHVDIGSTPGALLEPARRDIMVT